MPSPVGHSAAGIIIHSILHPAKDRRELFSATYLGRMAAYAVAANIPDLDFIAWTPDGLRLTGLYHHGITHSLGFAVIVAGAVYVCGRYLRRGYPEPGKSALAWFLLLASHGLLDALAPDENPSNGIGVPLFWPVDGGFFLSPVPLFFSIKRGDPLGANNMIAVVWESVVFSAAIIALNYKAYRRG